MLSWCVSSNFLGNRQQILRVIARYPDGEKNDYLSRDGTCHINRMSKHVWGRSCCAYLARCPLRWRRVASASAARLPLLPRRCAPPAWRTRFSTSAIDCALLPDGPADCLITALLMQVISARHPPARGLSPSSDAITHAQPVLDINRDGLLYWIVASMDAVSSPGISTSSPLLCCILSFHIRVCILWRVALFRLTVNYVQ